MSRYYDPVQVRKAPCCECGSLISLTVQQCCKCERDTWHIIETDEGTVGLCISCQRRELGPPDSSTALHLDANTALRPDDYPLD